MFDLISFIKAAGYLGLFLIIFAESGVFLGFFLPGDSLLFTAGLLASQGLLDIRILIIATFAGAVLGDSFGYAFGRKVGPRLFKKEDSLLFHKDYLERSRLFYERHGGKAIILARFFRFVRTFAPFVAGVGRIDYRIFLFYNLVGGALWAVGVTALGFYFGSVVPSVNEYILPVIAVIILFSLVPMLVRIGRNKQRRDDVKSFFRGIVAENRETRLRLKTLFAKIRKPLGVVLILAGLLALLTPLTPGSWLMFIGFELLGVRLFAPRRLPKDGQ